MNVMKSKQKVWIIRGQHQEILPAIISSYKPKNDFVSVFIKVRYGCNDSEILCRNIRVSRVFDSLDAAKNILMNSLSFDIEDMTKKIRKKEAQLQEVSGRFLIDEDFDDFRDLEEHYEGYRKQEKRPQ